MFNKIQSFLIKNASVRFRARLTSLRLKHRYPGLKTCLQTWTQADDDKERNPTHQPVSLFPISQGTSRFTALHVLAVDESGFPNGRLLRPVFVETVLQGCWFNSEAICEAALVFFFLLFGMMMYVYVFFYLCVCPGRFYTCLFFTVADLNVKITSIFKYYH